MNKLLVSASALALAVAFSGVAQAAQDAILDQDVDNVSATDLGQQRTNDMSTSGNNASGVLHFQENNGSGNVIGIATNIATTGDVDQYVDLDQSVTDSDASEIAVKNTQRDNQINGSLNGASGRVAVQQNNGDANAIGSNFAVMTDLSGDGGASQSVTVHQHVENNELWHIDDNDDARDRNNNINPSLNDFAGVATVQQNNGNGNAIGAANAIALGTENDDAVEQHVNVFGLTAYNFVVHSDLFTERNNAISDSAQGAEGVVTIQQNNGDANTMGVANAIYATEEDNNDNDIYQHVDVLGVADNQVIVTVYGERDNLIDNSFTDARGVLSVQQNNGTGNAMGIGNAIAINNGEGDVDQRVHVGGAQPMLYNESIAILLDFENERSNAVTGSFNGAEGVISVQQNNGDQNIMGIGHAVAVYGEDDTNDGQGTDDLDQEVLVGGIVTHTLTYDDDERVDEQDVVVDIIGERNNLINPSFNDAKGVISVQQNNGNGNVIGAGVALRVDYNGSDTDGDGEEVDTFIGAGGVVAYAASDDSSDNKLPRNNKWDGRNTVDTSFQRTEGVVTLQQNNGDANVLSQAVGVSMNLNSDDDIDTADAAAGTFGIIHGAAAGDGFLDRSDDGSNRLNEIVNCSFDGATGVIAVQQNNGDQNVVSSSTGVVANVNVGDTPGGVENNAFGIGIVDYVASFDDGVVDRQNTIDNSFNPAVGVTTVQQNNGNNNVVSSTTSVVASIDSEDFGPTVSNTLLAGYVSNALSIVLPTGGNPGALNEIDNSFNGYQGVLSVQQNNGNNNVIQSVTAVTANISTVE